VGLAIGCADTSRPVDLGAFESAQSTAVVSCAIPHRRGRDTESSGVYASMELTIAIGDTVRLARLWTTNPAAPSTASTTWRVADSTVARMEEDLVIPLDPGRTRVTGTFAGHVVCIGLATMLSGVESTALEVRAMSAPISLADAARLEATVRYSSGLALRVHEAVTWSSLDPVIAGVAGGGWVTPRAVGSARIVASAGRLADTVTVHVTNQVFESLVPRAAEDFVSSIGVNIHLSYFDRVYGSGYRTIILPRLQELGVRHLRDGGTWLPNQDWMREVYGRWQEVAQATGAKFTIIVSPRRTATGPGNDYGDVTHIRDLRDRIGADHIAAWEGLNEHDISGRPAFVNEARTLQQALFALVKGDPDMAARYRVLGPSMAFPGAAAKVGDLSAFMDEGTIHPYDGGKVPGSNLADHVNGVRALSGARPLVATEAGYHTSPVSTNPWHWSVSEGAQARYLLRQFLELYNAGVRRTFAYELIDEGTLPSEMEFHFGLLRNDGSRKPAFDALRNLITVLGDRNASAVTPHPLRVRLAGDTTGVRRLVVEKGDGRRYLLLWQNSRSFDEVARVDVAVPARTIDVTFATAPSLAHVYVPLQGANAIATYRNAHSLRLTVPDHPVLLELVN